MNSVLRNDKAEESSRFYVEKTFMRVEPNVVVSTAKKNLPKMVRVILTLTRMSGKVIQVRLENVENIEKHIRHFPLKCSPNIFEAKRELFVREHTPWTDKRCLFLIHRCNVNLVVTRKTVHKGKDLAPETFINDFINEGGRIVVFRIGTIKISISTQMQIVPCFLFTEMILDTQYVRGMG